MTEKDATPVLEHLAIDIAKDASAIALDCAMTNGSVVRFEVPAEALNDVKNSLVNALAHVVTAHSVAEANTKRRTAQPGEPATMPKVAPLLVVQELGTVTMTVGNDYILDLLTMSNGLVRIVLSSEQAQLLRSILSAPAASELQ